MVTKYIVVSKRAGRISCAESQTAAAAARLRRSSSGQKVFLNVVAAPSSELTNNKNWPFLRCASSPSSFYSILPWPTNDG